MGLFRTYGAAHWTNRTHSCSVNNTCENISPIFRTQFSAMTITLNVEEFHNLKHTMRGIHITIPLELIYVPVYNEKENKLKRNFKNSYPGFCQMSRIKAELCYLSLQTVFAVKTPLIVPR